MTNDKLLAIFQIILLLSAIFMLFTFTISSFIYAFVIIVFHEPISKIYLKFINKIFEDE